MGDTQGGRVGVDAISNHSVEDRPVLGNLVAGEETHNARVSMVKLTHHGHHGNREKRPSSSITLLQYNCETVVE